MIKIWNYEIEVEIDELSNNSGGKIEIMTNSLKKFKFSHNYDITFFNIKSTSWDAVKIMR